MGNKNSARIYPIQGEHGHTPHLVPCKGLGASVRKQEGEASIVGVFDVALVPEAILERDPPTRRLCTEKSHARALLTSRPPFPLQPRLLSVTSPPPFERVVLGDKDRV